MTTLELNIKAKRKQETEKYVEHQWQQLLDLNMKKTKALMEPYVIYDYDYMTKAMLKETW